MNAKKINIATVSVNTTPLDWAGNCQKLQGALSSASEAGAQVVVFPELVISGYGCEDAFFTEDLAETAMEYLFSLKVPEGVVAIVGLPVMVSNRLYNGAAVLTKGVSSRPDVHGIVLKRFLARNGVHYEPRWFQAWPENKIQFIETAFGSRIPVGDIAFSAFGARIGVEICEDAWVANRPGRNLFNKAVDIIVNPSASHFALGKYEVRQQFAKEASRSLGCAYVYANLNGCEAGRAVFDGGNFIVSAGEIVSAGDTLHFRDTAITYASVDLQENRIAQQWGSQSLDVLPPPDIHVVNTSKANGRRLPVTPLRDKEDEEALIVRVIALGLRDWMKKTGTNGFVVSLSGGADSALVAACVHAMSWLAVDEANKHSLSLLEMLGCDAIPLEFEKEHPYDITYRLLRTVYQGSANSSDTTQGAAKVVADGLGAHHDQWQIDDLVEQVTVKVSEVLSREMTWEKDDIALQNIQARVRAPGVWMLANTENKLLLATGNLSEMAMGYMTMDGDTCGVVAPISGLSKTRVRKVLRYLELEGVRAPYRTRDPLHMAFLLAVNSQQPTAELRPGQQDDESDLMPYAVSDFIRAQFLNQRRSPARILDEAIEALPQYSADQLAEWTVRFFELFSKTRWKTDRSAPGFHIESDSLDSRTFSRFPLLNSGWKKELIDLYLLKSDI